MELPRFEMRAITSLKPYAQDAYLRRTTAIEEKAQRWRDDLLVWFEVSLRRSAEHLANTDPATREKLEARLLPHPDDVEVDLAAGTILIRGPATRLEQKNGRR